MRQNMLRLFAGLLLVLFVASMVSAADSSQEYPVIYEAPPNGKTVQLVNLTNAGWTLWCKGYLDVKGGDYQINMSVPKGVRADHLRMIETVGAPRKIVDAIKYKSMTFLGVGTSNAHFCLGLVASNTAGGADNFVKNVWVWIKP